MSRDQSVQTLWYPGFVPSPELVSENAARFSQFPDKTLSRFESQATALGFTDNSFSLHRRVFQSLQKIIDSEKPISDRFADDPVIGRFFQSTETGFLLRGQYEWTDDFDAASLYQYSGATATGWKILQTEMRPLIVNDFLYRFLPTTLLLLVALWAVFRRLREWALATALLVTSLVTLVFVLSQFQIPWNFLNAMAIPLTVGVGMDYTIHLIFALRRSNGDIRYVWDSVGKAIAFCGLSTAVGFSSLLFTSSESLRSMGAACATGVIITMVFSLLAVPRLWNAAMKHSGQNDQASE